jgi:Phosphoesterase family
LGPKAGGRWLQLTRTAASRRLAPAALPLAVSFTALLGSLVMAAERAQGAITQPTPIKHVVVIYQENHSFDNVLGKLCVVDDRCDGVTTGKLLDGSPKNLTRADDVVVPADHSKTSQIVSINGGKMNGFGRIAGCEGSKGYPCYTQYSPNQIPNLATLARRFVVSDRTFSMDPIPSWGAHLELVAGQLNGFTGGLPHNTTESAGHKGWGCDSNRDAPWQPTPTAPPQDVPSCVPDYNLNPTTYPYGGAYRPTPVSYVPTIMDRISASGRNWKIYASKGPGPGSYQWAICPTFAECLYTSQRSNMVPSDRVITDAENGNLPNLSLVLPEGSNSQHNYDSMAKGDNWIANVVGAIQSGSDWRSTAVFITYDDCGCFYDHVPPPRPGWGIRVPMVIVSPYAKPGYTDSTAASFASMLAFTEHVFGLPSLANRDATAYDYSHSFNFNRPVMRSPKLTKTRISRRERRYLRAHPADPDDPT